MEYYNAIKSLLFIVSISLCSTASLPTLDKPCTREVSRLLKEYSENPKSMVLPQCNERGFYKALQRISENFYCSTSLGSPVEHRRYSVASKPCTELKECVKGQEAFGASDHRLIRCDEFGFFKPIQRTESGKICVSYYGNIIKKTNVNRRRDCYSYVISNHDNVHVVTL